VKEARERKNKREGRPKEGKQTIKKRTPVERE